MTNNASCLACGNALESTSHLFHDCSILKEIWSGLQGSRGFAVAGGSIQNESAEWIEDEHPLNTLIMNCWQLINEGWVMEIRYVFSCAHQSANLAHALEEDGVILESP
ncbi:hypothetical protein PVK06_048749 [Gossypium arboreum]|uniref:Reverse transcriptase zinc-binding domain-containing protein n=1 Tax=Gossypium arboreum TaxID=29729 RepID=A0ABR0MIT0_GOSAR|nr:hypothetical protein PVK06_048749 [Gossypium arboreum]